MFFGLLGSPYDHYRSSDHEAYIRHMERLQQLNMARQEDESKNYKDRLMPERKENEERLDMLFGRRT